MSHDRTGARRADARAFRPSLDGYRLESRQLLSATAAVFPKNQFLLNHPQGKFAEALNDPKKVALNAPHFHGPVYNHGVVDINTARGGASVIIAAPDGSRFRVSISLADNQFDGGLSSETGSTTANVIPSNVTQPLGTIRAYAMPGGKVGLIIDGSTQYQQLTVDPLPVVQRKGFAHSFGYGQAGRSHILNIGSIQVNSGQLQAILGFHSANLSGPLTIGGTGTVDRIAFNALLPGAAIGVGGTLNTLDVANSADLTAGAGVSIGRDLNLLNVGGDLTIANGAIFFVGRDLGLTLQPAKGTSTGSNILSVNIPSISTGITQVQLNPSVSAYIQGNVSIGLGSGFTIARRVDNAFFVLGDLTGATRFRTTGTAVQIPNPNFNPRFPAGPLNPQTIAVSSSLGFVHGAILP